MSKLSVSVRKPKIWTERVRRAWDLPEEIKVSEWADRYRVLGNEAAEPGKWRTDRTPYLRGIMDAAIDPFVEKITLMASSQVGKTESMLNILAYTIDQDPGPTLWVGPTEDVVKDFCKDRIQPMVWLSPTLESHLTNDRDDISQKGVKFDRMSLHLAWSNSPASLASRPIRRLFLDEIDKYPPFSGKEASPIDLAGERTRTFYNRLIVEASTPTTKQGPIWREYEKSDRRRYQMPCPHCGTYQFFFWDQIKFPKEERNADNIRKNRLAYYECYSCRGMINDNMKQNMLLSGMWVPEACSVNKKGQIVFEGVVIEDIPKSSHVGFWINAIYSPWLTFSDIAAKWLESYQDIERLMNFVNSWLAEPWEENLGTKKPDQLLRLATHYAAGVVPADIKVLVGGVDAQKDHFYLTIRGWGYHQKSHQILSKRVETWQDVEYWMIGTQYPFELDNVKPLSVRLFNVDSGDGNRTGEVYQFCRKWMGLANPVKGLRYITGIPYKVSNIDKFPDGRPIPGGLKLYLLDTTFFKDKITRLIENTKDGSTGGWFFHKDPSEEYLKQFCSEHKVITRDKKGRQSEAWMPVTRQSPTHFWDAEVYALAAAEMLHIPSMQPSNAKNTYNPAEHENKTSWIAKRTDWLGPNG